MRRGLLTGWLVLALIAGGCVWYLDRPPLSTVGAVAFDRELAIPPLAPSRVENGFRVFDLRADSGVTDFGHGETRTAGYNGSYLGPTLRVRSGEKIRVRVRNDLDQDSTVHWHGAILPAAVDGGPHRPIRPGRTADMRWTVDQPAATLWYHPHPDGHTEEQVLRGLAGMFLIDDDDPRTAALPHEYGVDDLPVIVQDRRFGWDGQFGTRPDFSSDVGVLGDTLLVNGTIGPYREVRTSLVRLRLLNGSNGRQYDFGFAGDRGFHVISTDGGMLAAPVPRTGIRLAPGERADIVVPMRPGERLVLRSRSPAPDENILVRRFEGGMDSFDVLELRAAATLTPSTPLPAVLSDLPPPDTSKVAHERSFEFYQRTINDKNMDMHRVDLIATAGTREIWTVHSTHLMPHVFHLHGQRFRVLDVDGEPPPPELSGWKDTLNLPMDVRFRLLVTFAGNADENTPYMYHCHVLRHEDEGMMGQFLVVGPGREKFAATRHHPGGP
ncbi:multicopper oxidase family protein [Actinoplanes derwentensis]|uniref:Multicopper oxidase with three cupredoxin domains (Includes cell division protein FtsP and spore coat protein CotA) n=1 Tax=Actinoplanes derwentensis TaxID=113562 RepID=A0A1H1R8M7_9ACTN|nr:multicopper oxidase domain-containing protein [Actinoplanes derwentensis]GID88039.1 multicopper oxidase [Actinoplanes derwentensis]SDS31846.1 Multicopper oxidase with three cupredoxin domains (includes cell division protein FtsP and spore coat protein CotA) [Actinoplanes derwentensis]